MREIFCESYNSALVVVGDISVADARSLAEHSFGKWAVATRPVLAIPTVPSPPSMHVVLVLG
jgi:predicted Zn-dependent peptidase